MKNISTIILTSLSNWFNIQIEELKQEVSPIEDLSQEDHSKFLKIKNEYNSLINRKFVLFSDRIKLEMPHLTRSQISLHFDWCNKQLSKKQKLVIIKKTYDNQIKEFISQTIKQIEDEKIFLKREAEIELKNQKVLSKKEFDFNLIKQWRKAKIKEMIQASEMRKKEMDDNLITEMLLETKKEKKKDYTKSLLDNYHYELSKKKEEENIVLLQLQSKIDLEKKLEISVR
jgi:hypothetical protein